MQILYQLQKQMPSSLFGDPAQALAFVNHAITLSRRTSGPEDDRQAPLRIVSNADEEDNEQVTETLHTAIEYLLASLEGSHNRIYRLLSDELSVSAPEVYDFRQ